MGDEVKYEIGDRIRATKGETSLQGVLVTSGPGQLGVAEAEWQLADLLDYGWEILIIQRARRFSIADIRAAWGQQGIDSAYNSGFAELIRKLEESNG